MQTKIKKIKRMTVEALRDSKDKTVLVGKNLLKINTLYNKRYSSHRKYLVHTEKDIKAGQKVVIEECRPISRKKAWKVIEVKE